MKRGYKFRIYPTKSQEEILRKTIGCCRFVYNHALALRRDSWQNKKKSVGYAETSAVMTQLRKHPDTEWLKDVSNVALQQALRNLETAYTNFFKYGANLPKFKKRKNGGSVRFTNWGFRLKKGNFYIAKIKTPIRVAWSRELSSKPSSCTVSQNPSGQWFASFVCEEDVNHLPKVSKKIGIDLGIETFATLSDGTKIKQSDSIRKSRRKLARAQRNHSRKKLGSKNREKTRLKVARVHQRITNIRTDFLHKLSSSIIHENQVIAIEDLAVAKMMKGRKLSRLISEQGWRDFRNMLEYKSDWYGRELIVVDRFFPSSKTCSCCGKQTELTLKDRVWSCACGATHDRDVNAAKNILAAGMAASACGTGVRLPRKRLVAKQEVLLERVG